LTHGRKADLDFPVPDPHHVLLVPGFFGFANLGDFAYFGHVRDFLAERGREAGIDGEVSVVATVPTASLRKRAARLAEAIAEVVDRSGGVVSIVGHSSGGLDARLVVTPDVHLPTDVPVERYAERVCSIVTVATPHFGTPVAHLFNSFLGQELLKLLSLATMYALRAGRLPLRAVLRLARVLRGRERAPSFLLEQLFTELLSDFTRDRRLAIETFFTSAGSDQDLLAQITPAGMDVVNASAQDRPGLRYGCVVTRARPPGLRSLAGAGFGPYAQATHALYVGLYRLASGTPAERAPRLSRAQAEALTHAYGRLPDLRANDGMVPTLSQVWGEAIAAVWADHHDVIGHFHHPTHVPPHFDWLHSGTGFDRAGFVATWRAAALWMRESAARFEVTSAAASSAASPGPAAAR
jgi:triacylglycerol lipase